jgi:non-specific serine/threonine protein kinase
VTKEQLLAAIWPGIAVTDTVLKVCVREVRDALDDDPQSPRYIETAHRLGYRFVGHVLPTNLPSAVSSLIGRRREIEELSGELNRSRLVTLVGPGGCGKSRLAIEVAATLGGHVEHGAWWVDLAPLSDGRFVPQAVAMALGVRDQPGESLMPLVGRFLATREVLLVVDNCEHVIDAIASLVHALLHRVAGLRVLATSREPFKIDGERVWVVPPLSIPTGDVSSAEEALEYEAVKLFEDRARGALSSFTLSNANCPAVVEICRRLEGMPLAIELAAARVTVLSVEQIADRLHDCFSVLGPGRRAELGRHQTLRAAIDWSYGLLTDVERCLLRRLSVFVDSFTLEVAERVAAVRTSDSASVLNTVACLIDKSLVFVPEREAAGRRRYRLLETVRQYAHEKLVDEEGTSEIFTRHATYYLYLAESTEPRINTSDRPVNLAALDREYSDLRAAMERSLHAGQFRHASRLAGALFWFWFHRGRWREGRTFLQSAIQHEAGPDRWRARVLLGDGVLAWAEGDHVAASARLEECVTLGRTLDDAPAMAHALHFLAMVRLAEGRAEDGQPLAEEAVRTARTASDPFCLTIALASHGVLLLALARYDDARAVLEESVERGRQMQDAWAVALPLRNLAIIAYRRGDHDRAQRLLEESLRGLRALGEKWFLSRSLETLAEVLASRGAHERAARLFGAAEGLRDAVGAPVLAFYRSDYEEAIVRARDAVGPHVFDQCWREGRAWTLEAAVAYALGESDRSPQQA